MINVVISGSSSLPWCVSDSVWVSVSRTLIGCTIKFVDIWSGGIEARVVVYCDYINSAGDIATVVLGEEMVASLIAKNALLY